MIESLIFAAITLFLLFRYRDVLGQRPEGDLAPPPVAEGASSADHGVTDDDPDAPLSLKAAIARMSRHDQGFSEAGFIRGAKSAFSMIVEHYHAGTLDAVKDLLRDDVYQHFVAARAADNQRRKLLSVVGATILKAGINGTRGVLTVEFVSQQQEVDSDGSPKAYGRDLTVEDIWTFERDVADPDPNWKLVAVPGLS